MLAGFFLAYCTSYLHLAVMRRKYDTLPFFRYITLLISQFNKVTGEAVGADFFYLVYLLTCFVIYLMVFGTILYYLYFISH